MIANTSDILFEASSAGYAVGAFNVYNMEGALAVIEASEDANIPAIIQLHPGSLEKGGDVLINLCLSAAQSASTNVSVHLDHCDDPTSIDRALYLGMNSIMADGSSMRYLDNINFTKNIANQIHKVGGFVEAELGRLSGTEDGLTIPEYQAKLTDPLQAVEFVRDTGIDALAVCIGNVHGKYAREPVLDFERLETINRNLNVPLVIHGGSGLPEWMVNKCIQLGVRKFNVNTEIRTAYLETVQALTTSSSVELTSLISESIRAMRDVIYLKIKQFAYVR